MANVAHKNLTGTDLHEPKGVAAATVDKVYVSDGAGSGAWQKIDRDQLDSANGGNPMVAVFHCREKQATTVNGGALTSGSWQTRVLNTSVQNAITSASINTGTGVMSLPAGTYRVQAYAVGHMCDNHAIRLRNTTDGTTLLVGLNAFSTRFGDSFAGQKGQSTAELFGVFTIAGTKNIELQHRGQTTRATDGLGSPNSFGEDEVYADILFHLV